RREVFYRFNIQFNDGLVAETPTPDWIVAHRMPTNEQFLAKGESGYFYIEDLPREDNAIETKDCPADPKHVTHSYYKVLHADAAGWTRLSPFVPASNGILLAVNDELQQRIKALNVRGARLDLIRFVVNQSDLEKPPKIWALQFVGRAARRKLRFIDAPNRCPH